MEHGEAVEVVGEVGQGGFEATSSPADAAEVIAAELGDAPKDVFNPGANAALFFVAALLVAAQWLPGGAFFVDVGEHAKAIQ
jgi:hypothetical protein